MVACCFGCLRLLAFGFCVALNSTRHFFGGKKSAIEIDASIWREENCKDSCTRGAYTWNDP
jgi:hypothetical protein